VKWSKGRIIRIVVINVVILAVIFVLMTQWRYTNIGTYAIRKNVLTGNVQIRRGASWVNSFQNDAQAPRLTEEDLQGVQLKKVQWGPDGLVCGTIFNTSENKDVKGRLALLVIEKDGLGRQVRNRSLRVTVNWGAREEIPFVLDTSLAAPANNTKSVLRLETIN